jgi:tetratricopeptide (TPR) repeat protein
MPLDDKIKQAIYDKLATFDRKLVLEAVEITAQFPAPEGGADFEKAQALHDTAQTLEALQEWRLCIELYDRALAYARGGARHEAGAWYRKGVCQEKQGRYREAMHSYAEALRREAAWPEVGALSRRDLAALHRSAEEHEQAVVLLEALAQGPAWPGISREQVRLHLADCCLRSGRTERARALLLELLADGGPAAVEALPMLAHLHERQGETREALRRYHEIAESPGASPLERMAAHARIAALDAKR